MLRPQYKLRPLLPAPCHPQVLPAVRRWCAQGPWSHAASALSAVPQQSLIARPAYFLMIPCSNAFHTSQGIFSPITELRCRQAGLTHTLNYAAVSLLLSLTLLPSPGSRKLWQRVPRNQRLRSALAVTGVLYLILPRRQFREDGLLVVARVSCFKVAVT